MDWKKLARFPINKGKFIDMNEALQWSDSTSLMRKKTRTIIAFTISWELFLTKEKRKQSYISIQVGFNIQYCNRRRTRQDLLTIMVLYDKV
jgi:hypothetical protein